MTLTQFNNNGVELIIDEKGEVYYPGYNALARVCSLGLSKPIDPKQAQRTVLGTMTKNTLESAEVLTPQGLRTVTLIPRKTGSSAIKKYNPDLWEEMGEAGHLMFLHQLAGYKIESKLAELPAPTPQSRYYIGMVTEEPKDWSEHFDTEFRFHACRLTEWDWNWKCMSGFINSTVYSYLPAEVKTELDRVNPCINGNRPNKQHQHIDARVLLKEHIIQVKVCMRTSKSMQEFLTSMNANFHGALQMKLF